MTTAAFELLPELLELAFFGLGSVGLSIAGAYIERFAFLTARSGEVKLGVWVGIIGAAALLFAYLLATDKFAAKLTEVRRAANELPE